jgi:hypothetical protein
MGTEISRRRIGNIVRRLQLEMVPLGRSGNYLVLLELSEDARKLILDELTGLFQRISVSDPIPRNFGNTHEDFNSITRYNFGLPQTTRSAFRSGRILDVSDESDDEWALQRAPPRYNESSNYDFLPEYLWPTYRRNVDNSEEVERRERERSNRNVREAIGRLIMSLELI